MAVLTAVFLHENRKKAETDAQNSLDNGKICHQLKIDAKLLQPLVGGKVLYIGVTIPSWGIVVVLPSYTAEVHHNHSLTPPPQTKKDGKNRMESRMEKAQGLR